MTIGEFSAISGISAYTLRYYEKKGLIRVGRDNTGKRNYSEKDIEWVKFIQLLKDTGMLLRDIRRYSDLRYQGDGTMAERMELLVSHRKSVMEEHQKWDEYLYNLEEKIKFYKKNIDLSQKRGKAKENTPVTKTTVILKKAESAKQVAAIAAETIQKVYPKYYPAGAVRFFLDLHSVPRVEEAMNSEEIYFVIMQGIIVGTGTIRKNEICRLFILPKYQRKGYGSKVMDLLERKIFEKYPVVHVDASFPAENMYFKREYQITSYETIETENGDYLCYHTMEKKRELDVK